MSSQMTETSSDEYSNFTETESCTIDDNLQPVLLKNPFYYKTENLNESMKSRSSILDHKPDSDSDDSDDSVISEIEETMSDSLDNKIEIDSSQDEKGNEIVLKNFPGRITIKYSPSNRKKSGNKIGRIIEVRGVQTDGVHDGVNDHHAVKEEPQSQNNELIKGEESGAINNEANVHPLYYSNTKEENHLEVLEQVDEEDDEVFIPKVQSRNDVDQLNAFQIEVTLVEMDVEVSQHDTTDDIKVERSTNEDNENRSETPEFHEEVKREIKTDSSSQSASEISASSSRMNVEGSRQIAITIMDVEMPQDDTTDSIKVEHSTNENYVNHSEIFEFHEKVKDEIKTNSSSPNASEVGVSLLTMNMGESREDVINSNFQNEIPQQHVQSSVSEHEEEPNVKHEDMRENISQNPDDSAGLRNVDGLAQGNVDINIKFGEMEFEEAQEEPGDERDAGVCGNNNDLQMNISRVDVPQVQMEVEESQVLLSNDENNKNLCNEEQSMVQEQMPVVNKPRIYVKSRTQLFPEGYQSFNSSQEGTSPVPLESVHNKKRLEAELLLSDDSSDNEWLKSEPARAETRMNKEPSKPKPPHESQDLVRRRGVRTKILPQPSQKPIMDPSNNETATKIEQPSSPCSSEAETVILPWKLERGTQASLQAPGERVTQRRDAVSEEILTVTDTFQQTEKKDNIVYSLASKFYRGKPYSPQEDQIIVQFLVSRYKKFELLVGNPWEALAKTPEMCHRTVKSLENRYTRYLRGRAQHYVKDPEIRKWFVNPTKEKKQAPNKSQNNHSNDDDSEDDL